MREIGSVIIPSIIRHRGLFSLNDQVGGKVGDLEFYQDGTDCRIGDIRHVKFDEK